MSTMYKLISREGLLLALTEQSDRFSLDIEQPWDPEAELAPDDSQSVSIHVGTAEEVMRAALRMFQAASYFDEAEGERLLKDFVATVHDTGVGFR